MVHFIVEAIKNGGGWSYLVLLAAAVFWGLLIFQFFNIKIKDLRAVLWGVFGFLLLAGPLGTVVGFTYVGAASASAAAADQVSTFGQGFSICMHTTFLSFFFCALGIIPLFIAVGRVARHQ